MSHAVVAEARTLSEELRDTHAIIDRKDQEIQKLQQQLQIESVSFERVVTKTAINALWFFSSFSAQVGEAGTSRRRTDPADYSFDENGYVDGRFHGTADSRVEILTAENHTLKVKYLNLRYFLLTTVPVQCAVQYILILYCPALFGHFLDPPGNHPRGAIFPTVD